MAANCVLNRRPSCVPRNLRMKIQRVTRDTFSNISDTHCGPGEFARSPCAAHWSVPKRNQIRFAALFRFDANRSARSIKFDGIVFRPEHRQRICSLAGRFRSHDPVSAVHINLIKMEFQRKKRPSTDHMKCVNRCRHHFEWPRSVCVYVTNICRYSLPVSSTKMLLFCAFYGQI